MTSPPRTLGTFGHGTADQETLVRLLSEAGVRRLVDIRRFPGSRAHPHVAREAMTDWVPQAGIEYRWEPRLGGRRRLSRDAPSPDVWWTVEAFRAYAGYTRTSEFSDALEELLGEVAASPGRGGGGLVAVMCSESLWWRCHRRLVADVVALTRHCEVVHLMHARSDVALVPHRPAAGARVVGEQVIWDAADSS